MPLRSRVFSGGASVRNSALNCGGGVGGASRSVEEANVPSDGEQ